MFYLRYIAHLRMLRGTRADRRGMCLPLIIGIAFIWIVAFAMSRVHIMQQAYTDFAEIREDESWLLGQCTSHEFYSRLKQHSTLCDEVKHKANDILILKALQHMIDNSYLCGYEPCFFLFDRLVAWALGRGIVFTICVVLLLVFGPVCLLPIYRRHMNMLTDERVNMILHDYKNGQLERTSNARQNNFIDM